MTTTARRFSDAAHRYSDAMRLHIVAGQAGRWAAIRLSDGGSDGVAYDSKQDAVRHQLHEFQCLYTLIPPDDVSPRIAEHSLAFNRWLYDHNMRFIDPDRDRQLLMPTRLEDLPR